MVTKTELYALDLSSFTDTIARCDLVLREDQAKLDDIAHAKELITQTMQGQSADALLANLQKIESQINTHIALVEELQTVVTTYRTNKTSLQGDVITLVEQIELHGFVVTDTWGVRPLRNRLLFASPKDIGRLFILATQYRNILAPRVSAFEQYDLQAAITAGPGATPYTTWGGYSTVEPDRTQKWDEDFVWGSKKGQANAGDYALWEAGQSGLGGAYSLGMTDAARCYAHFRDNTGTPMSVDYERAYKEDAGIRNHVNGELNGALAAANEAALAGQSGVTLHGPQTSLGATGNYPETANWRWTLGGHNTYTDTDVQVNGDTITATVTVHARDKWNFNRGDHDSITGLGDDVNGRFEELGWAKSFETSGSMTKTYTWKVGQQPPFQPVYDNNGRR
ncbi:hypothetical protein FBF35_03495 [Schaalia odontolytica]|uniref:Uncharacterized protein n=1 Tax=Schaalia odontolytica TaxID=1660 RepID=A0A0V8RSS8_9ACTO|nr:hypothetical protein [Schaalia odontolytica]KSW11016.1 hypothetical protein APY09_05975 [Schaalia odontolytica]QCT35165.1 hypothetical protein FBF35_03495 [Schaalia odontolytica]